MPCPISTYLMAYALGAGAPLLGAAVCLAFGVGLGTALLSISLLAWLFRGRIASLLASRARSLITVVIPIAGAVLLIAFGILALPL